MREEVQWLRRRGMEQDRVGRMDFSLAIGGHRESIFQAKGVNQPGCGTEREVPITRGKAKQSLCAYT